MKSWKKKWKEELDLYAGNLRDDVLNAEIECVKTPEHKPKIPLKQKITSFVFKHKTPVFVGAGAFALVLILCFTLLFSIAPATQNKTVTTLLVEVNPSILFCADKDGKVVSLISTNADGDVILCNENTVNSLIGADLQNAITTYTDVLNKLGYLDGKVGMRLSGYGNKELLNSCKTNSENYLLTHGFKIAVIFQTPSEKEFLTRSGLLTNTIAKVSDLYKQYTKKTELFINRNSSEQNKQQIIANAYSKIVNEECVVKNFEQQLKTDKQKLVDLLNEIDQLVNANNAIKNNADTPSFLGYKLNYWDIKSSTHIDYDSLTETLKSLMQDMQNKLKSYENTHKTAIKSESELLLKQLNLSLLVEMIDLFSLEFLSQYYDMIYGFLGEINSVAQDTLNLLDTPKTEEQYNERINHYYNSREKKNSDNYNNGKAPVSSNEYQNFLNQIIAEYGSLENFWENSSK